MIQVEFGKIAKILERALQNKNLWEVLYPPKMIS